MTSFASVYPGGIQAVILLLALSAFPGGHFQLGNTVLKNREEEIERDLHNFFSKNMIFQKCLNFHCLKLIYSIFT